MKKQQQISGRITALEPQKRHPDRMNLYLDGRFACGLSERVVFDNGLHVGKDLSSEDLAVLLGDEETQRAFNAAYLLLSYRSRSLSEIENRLRQKGFAPPLVKRVTEDLTAAGLLDDTAFAEGWVRNRQQSKPRGKSLLRWELRQKGVSRETAESALESLQPEDESEAAQRLARKYLEREKSDDPRVRQRRVIGMLQRRGYNWEVIREALGALEELLRGDEPLDEF
ncbi:MAG: RecX family transcriptional regulator [Armatimonadetes bacterium]|nr:RecX family transcriptional regulator [Armatimonadota bacterium]